MIIEGNGKCCLLIFFSQFRLVAFFISIPYDIFSFPFFCTTSTSSFFSFSIPLSLSFDHQKDDDYRENTVVFIFALRFDTCFNNHCSVGKHFFLHAALQIASWFGAECSMHVKRESWYCNGWARTLPWLSLWEKTKIAMIQILPCVSLREKMKIIIRLRRFFISLLSPLLSIMITYGSIEYRVWLRWWYFSMNSLELVIMNLVNNQQ